MEIIQQPLNGLKLIQLKNWQDERGFFAEKYSSAKFASLGITNNFVQDNHSFSHKGVVRGLHFQANPDQAKLVYCITGKILDVAVDIRAGSPSFGQHFAVEITPQNALALFIPAGFAHGFSALEDSNVLYKVDGGYNPKGEGAINVNDTELAINWQVIGQIISGKDKAAPSFAEYKQNPLFKA